MLISVQIFLLLCAIGGFPSSLSERSKQELIDLSKWALTQVFIYYTEEFDQLAIPDCHGTLLTDQHVLAKGSCVTDQEIILIVKVHQSMARANQIGFDHSVTYHIVYLLVNTSTK